MKFSVRWKIISVFLAIIVVSMVVLTVLSSVLLKPVFVANTKKTMISYSKEIDKLVTDGNKDTDSLFEEINTSYGITVHIVNEKGEILLSSINKTDSFDNKQTRYIKMYNNREHNEDYLFGIRENDNSGRRTITFVCKLRNGNYIIMKKTIKGLEENVNIVSVFILIMGCTIAVAGTVVWSIFTKSFTDNIGKMSRITQNMSKLNFEEKINMKSKDELGILAESIDALSDELKNSIEGLKKDIEHRKRLVRDISHELKTPITTIEGYIESIQVRTEDNERVQKYCRIATEECDEISALVEEMLETSRMESEEYVCEKEIVDVQKIARIIKNKTDAEYPSQKISISFAPCELWCNDILVSRAIMNYVKNAVKYGEANKEIIVSGEVSEGRYVFSVVNEGLAISEEEKVHIWDLFYKNDRSRRRDNSHGIGLAMVKRIAQLHNGEVDVISRDKKNTFYLYIPLGK